MQKQCVACHQPVSGEQPAYCTSCFVPVPQMHNDKYLGSVEISCSDCGKTTSNREQCENCTAIIDLKNIPLELRKGETNSSRAEKREQLAQSLLGDHRMAQQMLQIMGIDHLEEVEQGVALVALAREKMNFLSSDYNLTEAHTLADLGYGICEQVGEQWAINIASTRLAQYYIRAGDYVDAANLLIAAYEKHGTDTVIRRLQRLEILALFALSTRLLGLRVLADDVMNTCLQGLQDEFKEMQLDLEEYLKGDMQSQLLGLDDSLGTFPRVDMVAAVLIVLVEDAMVRGSYDDQAFSNVVLDRMLQLDNMIDILGKMSPEDEPGYFGAFFRDYIRLFNGLFWYGDVLIQNDRAKREVVLELAYSRILQWIDILPVGQWLVYRPARLIEIFYRASKWNQNIEASKLAEMFLERTDKYLRPQFLFTIAEAEANIDNIDQAIDHLRELLSQKYEDIIEDTLRSLAENMLWKLQLEIIGILQGVSMEETRLDLPVNIQLNEMKSFMEPESYLLSENRDPILRLTFEEPEEIIRHGIAIFGERLIGIEERIAEQITKIGDLDYKSSSWNTPYQQDKTIEGYRMDLVIIQTEIRDDIAYLLFEGKDQSVREDADSYHLFPSSLLILRGIIHHNDLLPHEVVETLIELLSADQEILDKSIIFTLKK